MCICPSVHFATPYCILHGSNVHISFLSFFRDSNYLAYLDLVKSEHVDYHSIRPDIGPICIITVHCPCTNNLSNTCKCCNLLIPPFYSSQCLLSGRPGCRGIERGRLMCAILDMRSIYGLSFRVTGLRVVSWPWTRPQQEVKTNDSNLFHDKKDIFVFILSKFLSVLLRSFYGHIVWTSQSTFRQSKSFLYNYGFVAFVARTLSSESMMGHCNIKACTRFSACSVLFHAGRC